jgi:signal transduction histidine kinase/DNA-binding response OmpR family regulator
MYKRFSFFYLIVFCFQIIPDVAASDTLSIPALYPSSYTVYDIEQGLPFNCIDQTFTDLKGRLWINHCIQNHLLKEQGFFMYDGSKYYDIQMLDPNAPEDRHVYYIEGITKDGLLFGKDKPGRKCFVLNSETQQKQFYSFNAGEIITYLLEGEDNDIIAIVENGEGWTIYELKNGTKKRLAVIPTKNASKRLNLANDNGVTKAGKIIWFINNYDGFIKFDIEQQNFKAYYWENFFDDYLNLTMHDDKGPYFFDISADGQGNPLFYIRKLNQFFSYDIASDTLKDMKEVNDFFQFSEGFYANAEYFFKDKQGNVLIQSVKYKQNNDESTYRTKVILIDKAGKISDYTAVASVMNEGRFDTGEGNHFFGENFKKNVIVSTAGGLFVVDLKVDYSIQTFFKGRPARAMIEIDPGKILVVNERDQKELIDLRRTESYLQSSLPLPIPKNLVVGLSQLIQKDNKIWFATINHQLANCHKSTSACSFFEVGKSFEKFNFISDQEVALVDSKFDLYIYDLSQKELRPFLLNGTQLNIQGAANELYISRDSTLWIASLNGLWKIDFKKGVVIRFGKDTGFQDDRVMCIQKALDGKLWLGTYAAGIHIYDPKTGTVEVRDQNNGLSNNTVVGLLQDNEGYWWASTFDGITVLSEDGQVLFELSENEGLSHREFNRFSYLKTSDGKLLFGAIDGVSLLDPEKIKNLSETKENLQIYVTDIAYFDKTLEEDIHLKDPIKWKDQIIIPATHRYIDLDFGLSEYNNPEKNIYFYRIQKMHEAISTSASSEKWTSIGYNSNLILNNMPTGEYNILIKAINYKGQWTKNPIVIPVSVKEFFYKTWWFYLLCSIPLLLGAYFWIHRLTTERERLEKEVAQRTQQIRQDKELIEKQAAELQELDELKSRFFTNISHEFRTPLTVISGMITQMEQQPDRWMKKGTDLIKRNSHHLLSLINQILDLRKIESNALKPNLVLGDVVSFLKYLADSFTPMAQSKGLRIHFLSAIPSFEMDYDPDKMLHVLSNLLSNAIKFTDGPGDIYIQVSLQSDASGQEMLNIQVKDTGKGIPQEALPYIFDRFYQVKDLATQKPMGTGIGLALTKELVQLLNGTIQVESILDVGTTFSLNFLITREATNQGEGFMSFDPSIGQQEQLIIPTEEVADTGLQNVLSNSSMSDEDPDHESLQPTLLIVEDNLDVQVYLTSCLENQYHLIYAENGQVGIDLALEQVPDLIVSDVMMPVKDGFALCNTLKEDERTSHIPIVLLTAKADFDSKMQGLRKGADAYLTKPFEQEELLVILQNLLEVRKKLQKKYANLAFTTDNEEDTSIKTMNDFEDAFIKKVNQIIVSHMDEPDLSGEFISRKMNMSRANLYRKLKALTDLPISHFIRNIRLQHAKELLVTTEMNVSEVAYAVGFSDPKYFSRIFSETFQQSPSQFRNT